MSLPVTPRFPAIELMRLEPVPGFVRGLTQPSLRLHLRLRHELPDAWRARGARLLSLLAGSAGESQARWWASPTPDAASGLAQAVGLCLCWVQRQAGWPLWCAAQAEWVRLAQGEGGARSEALVLVPSVSPQLLRPQVQALLGWLNAWLDGNGQDLAGCLRLVGELTPSAPPGAPLPISAPRRTRTSAA
jgi:hypothetical protein